MNIAREDIMKVFGFVINCLVSKICSFEKLLQDENPIMLCLQETKQSKFIHRKHYRNVGINKDLISVVEVLTGHFLWLMMVSSHKWTVIDPTTFLVCDHILTQLVF